MTQFNRHRTAVVNLPIGRELVADELVSHREYVVSREDAPELAALTTIIVAGRFVVFKAFGAREYICAAECTRDGKLWDLPSGARIRVWACAAKTTNSASMTGGAT